MAKLHEKLPGSRFVALPGAGHISNMDRPAEFSRAPRVSERRVTSRYAFSAGHAARRAGGHAFQQTAEPLYLRQRLSLTHVSAWPFN
jgi:hypothetical protein